jgi:aminoglycoside phosphotransferase (APT) family kinase protein
VSETPPGVDLERLRPWFGAHVPGATGGELHASLLSGGRSNLTYAVGDDANEWVLRRPPLGHVLPTAHDMAREYAVLTALAPTDVPVPRTYAFCDDTAVNDAPFYVMERVDGEVITSELPAALDDRDQRRLIADELIDALVEVHAVDWEAVGLEGFGKPSGYLERQLRRFNGLWEINRTRELPAVERVGAWLADNLPESGPATIVHGDFRLGNVMYADSAPARLVAIFDWEMATIGDPLADVGYLIALWSQASDPTGGLFDLSRVTRLDGFPTRAEIVARYEERSGRSMRDARWYMTLALWKSVVFMEGNYKRALAGTTDDPFLKAFGEGVLELARRAEGITEADPEELSLGV